MSKPLVPLRHCQLCNTKAACARAGRCRESVELEMRNERVKAWDYGDNLPASVREHRRIKEQFSGYLLVGGPHDADFVCFPERGVMRLQRAPRPGWPERSSEGRIAIEEYEAEFLIGGSRFYRHKSLTLRDAVNRILLWYLPPDVMNDLVHAATMRAADELLAKVPRTVDHDVIGDPKLIEHENKESDK